MTTRFRAPRSRAWRRAVTGVALAAAAVLMTPVGVLTATAAPSESASPSPSATPTATASPSPSATPSGSPSPSPTPSSSPSPTSRARTVAPKAALSEGQRAVAAKYREVGAATVGKPISGQDGSGKDVRCGLRDGGCYQRFASGSIHWTKATGAHFVRGSIFDAWHKQSWEGGFLGYPLTDERCGLKDGGCYQTFQGGSIHWTRGTGAHWTRGTVRSKWSDMGWEQSLLGYPLTDERCGLKDGGCYQTFQGGSIHWTRGTGAHWTRGTIRSKWSAMGWERSSLRYPVSDERCGLKNGGCYQIFQGGLMYWSRPTGAHPVAGSVLSMYKARGYERGSYGYPTSDAYGVSGKTSQRFQGGYLTTGVDKRCLTGRTMCVSKKDRKLRWMVNGQVLKTLDARFGCPSSPSDNGSFKVYFKSYNHTSTLYNTWMPRAMFYHGGEAVHYSPDFAARGYAGCSHGCTNIRDWNGINWLYKQVRVGDRVVVYG